LNTRLLAQIPFDDALNGGRSTIPNVGQDAEVA
jgi:hypothetical protein